MEWTPCKIALQKCVKYDRDGLFVAAIKSSTKTSMIFLYVTDAVRLCRGFYVWYDILYSSKLCSGRFTSCNSVSITSLYVSDAAQKKGGYSHHLICRQFGTNTSMSSMFPTLLNCGST